MTVKPGSHSGEIGFCLQYQDVEVNQVRASGVLLYFSEWISSWDNKMLFLL